MKFIKRIWNLILTRANAAVDYIESPEDKLSLFLKDLQGKISDLQSSVTCAVVEEKKLQRTLELQVSEAKKWEERAKMAVSEKNDDLARQALVEQSQVLVLAEATNKTLVTQQNAVEELKKSLIFSKSKLDEARRQYQLTMARYKSAETKVKLSEAISSTSAESPLHLLEELDNKILELEAESECQLEANSITAEIQDLESQFKSLEQNKDIEDRLKMLKSGQPILMLTENNS